MILVSGLNCHDSMLFERCLPSKDSEVALAADLPSCMLTRVMTTNAAETTSGAWESSAALLAKALKAARALADTAGLSNARMAGLRGLENCAFDSRGNWRRTWRYCCSPLPSSAQGLLSGCVRFYVLRQATFGNSRSRLKAVWPFQIANATRKSLRARITIDSVVEKPLVLMCA